MTSEVNTKVRLVRCPKCHLVLPELSEIPVYKCGGCNTLLQAKNGKADTKETGFDCNKSDENGSKKADQVSSYSHSKKDIEISENSDKINMKQLGNHVYGDENTGRHQERRVSDDSMELEIDDVSLDEDIYDTGTDGIVSDSSKRENLKDSSFFDDVPFVMTDSSPENGLNNKERGKSVQLSRKHRTGSKIASHQRELQSVREEEQREGIELLKVWTFKGLRAQESDSLSNLPLAKPQFVRPVISRYNRPGVYDQVRPFHDNFQDTKHYGLCKTRPQNEDHVPRLLRDCQVHNYGLCSPDKFELLKTINELKDELKRTQISNIRFPTRSSNEQNRTVNFLHCSHPSKKFSQVNYVSHNKPRVSRMESFLTCCDEARHRFSSSKRYIRPTAGGIPFVTCYHCSELLQFPADFLIFGRRFHRLKCNTCRKTMIFSIQGKRHLVPYIPDSVALPHVHH